MNCWKTAWLAGCGRPVLVVSTAAAFLGVEAVSSWHEEGRSDAEWSTRFNLDSSFGGFDASSCCSFFLESDESVNFLLSSPISVVDFELNVVNGSPLGEVFGESFVPELQILDKERCVTAQECTQPFQCRLLRCRFDC